MPENKPDALVAAVQEIKTAIQNAQLQTPEIVVTKAAVVIKTTLTGGPNATLKLGPVEIGAKYSLSQIQTLSLTLTPAPKEIELFGTMSDALTSGIVAICNAAREAAISEPPFSLEEATVEVNFTTDSSGKVTFVLGGEIGHEVTHTLRLTLKNSG
jgi:hypothetical protein